MKDRKLEMCQSQSYMRKREEKKNTFIVTCRFRAGQYPLIVVLVDVVVGVTNFNLGDLKA